MVGRWDGLEASSGLGASGNLHCLGHGLSQLLNSICQLVGQLLKANQVFFDHPNVKQHVVHELRKVDKGTISDNRLCVLFFLLYTLMFLGAGGHRG